MSKLFLGIDVSKDVLDVCLILNQKTLYHSFKNNQKGFFQLVHWLKKQEAVLGLHICMEATGSYSFPVADYLYAHSFQVSVVNPARIKAYRDSGLRRNKTDKLDAFVIADFCRAQNPLLWTPPTPEYQELKALTRYLDDLMGEIQQVKNRFGSGISSDYVLLNLREQIDFLNKKITEVKKQIQAHIKEYPNLLKQSSLLISIIGIGPLTAARLLAEIQDFSRFDSVAQLDAYAGLSPSLFESGTSIHKKSRLSKKGNANLRRALYFPAIVAIQHNPIVMNLSDRLTQRDKSSMVIIGASMRKLLHLAYGVLKTGKDFDPNYLSLSV
jgi:transposase